VIGVALVLLKQSPEFPVFRPLSYGVIDAIAVDAGWRRRGAGRALVAAATAWAESRGAAWLELGVYEFNRDALAFYDALGFQTASRKLRRPLRGSGPEGERLE
ncbi:MAG TPA: GNAT family N-acetyltransferase, partial [Polyangiaceae bacterium]|nr:GNAT family N-acetyltransferase [Polyangiaceae bacterium]